MSTHHASKRIHTHKLDATVTRALPGESLADVARRLGDLRLVAVLGALNPALPRFGALAVGTEVALPTADELAKARAAARIARAPLVRQTLAPSAAPVAGAAHADAVKHTLALATARVRAALDAVHASCKPAGVLALLQAALRQPQAMVKHLGKFGVRPEVVRGLVAVAAEAIAVVTAARELAHSGVPLFAAREGTDARAIVIAERIRAQIPMLDDTVQMKLGVDLAVAPVLAQLRAFATALEQASKACAQLPILAQAFAAGTPQIAGPALAKFVEACVAADVPAALRDRGVVAALDSTALSHVAHNPAAMRAHIASTMIGMSRHADLAQRVGARVGPRVAVMFDAMAPLLGKMGTTPSFRHARGALFTDAMIAAGGPNLAACIDGAIAAATRALGRSAVPNRAQRVAIDKIAARVQFHFQNRPASTLARAVLVVAMVTDSELSAQFALDDELAWVSVCIGSATAALSAARHSFERCAPAPSETRSPTVRGEPMNFPRAHAHL